MSGGEALVKYKHSKFIFHKQTPNTNIERKIRALLWNVDDDKWSDIIFVVSVCEINPEPAIRVPTLLSCWVRNLEKDKQQEFKFQAPPANRDYHAIIWCGHPSFFVPWETQDSQCNRPCWGRHYSKQDQFVSQALHLSKFCPCVHFLLRDRVLVSI